MNHDASPARTLNEIRIERPLGRVFELASDVLRWPVILPHYRDVRFVERDGESLVRMEAFRHLGPLPYPIWWESRMRIDPELPRVSYRHVRGITREMDVWWDFEALSSDATHVSIVHEWRGPSWPVIGRFAAHHVICPHFVHVVAGRTLAGVKREAERGVER